MKKQLKFLLMLTISIALISSCTMEKRLHNKGFYVSWNKNWKANETITQPNNEIAKSEIKDNSVNLENRSIENSTLGEVTSASEATLAQETKIVTPKVEENRQQQTNNAVASTNNKTSINHVKESSNSTFAKVTKSHNEKVQAVQNQNVKSSQKSSQGGSFSGGMLVLMIILCLFPFINLIPVYLHDDSVTMNFWLTLILDVLFALPGIIFAILVVLDVANIG